MSNEKYQELFDLNISSPQVVLDRFKTRISGLTKTEVLNRRLVYGANETVHEKQGKFVREFFAKLTSPLSVMLFVVAGFSFYFGQNISAIIVIAMAGVSVVLSSVQELKASNSAKKLKAMVHVQIEVMRDGKIIKVPIREIVPGDIVELVPGGMTPADIKIISGNGLTFNQATLNGESFPVEKNDQGKVGINNIYELSSIALMGSSVVSGMGKGLVIATGLKTEFGRMAKDIAESAPDTPFDQGLKQFTWLMIRLITGLVIFIFLINTLLKGDFIASLLFSLAVAVGLTPEMLPMIVTLTLSKGAMAMSKKKVIIKRLDAIQNFGAMDVLCTDKTGTLTLDEIALVRHCDANLKDSDDVWREACITSALQGGAKNVLDDAIINYKQLCQDGVKKITEIPFDFERRLMSVVIKENKKLRLITKGAPEGIFSRISLIEVGGKNIKVTKQKLVDLQDGYDRLSKEGFRVLAVAYKEIDDASKIFSKQDESDLIFKGFVAFLDPPKPTAQQAVDNLEALGITLKVISGDNALVTEKICHDVAVNGTGVLTGMQIEEMNDVELAKAVELNNIFARTNPLQKERIIAMLQRNGHIVGYLGDGINDAPAIKAADVGISVDTAFDIAKETADIILLEKDLNVLADCVKEGRRTFANTLKYIKMGASSNFGNMLSMTGASMILPFLPMLPAQILLNNFLYDASQAAIPTDNVDEEYLLKPRPWKINFIQRFVLIFGPISSIFDFATFGLMWYVFQASPEMFRTGWFVESLFTQTLIIFIIRTNKVPFLQSWPSKALGWSAIFIVVLGCLLPYTRLGASLGFVPLPLIYFGLLLIIALIYLLLTQLIKGWFIRKYGFD